MSSEIKFTPFPTTYKFEEELTKLEKVADEVENSQGKSFLTFNRQTGHPLATSNPQMKATNEAVTNYTKNVFESYDKSLDDVRNKELNKIKSSQFIRLYSALKKIEKYQHVLEPETKDQLKNAKKLILSQAKSDEEKITSLKKKIMATGFDPKAEGFNEEILNTLSIDDLKTMKDLTRLRASKKAKNLKGKKNESVAYVKINNEIKKLLNKLNPRVETTTKIRFKDTASVQIDKEREAKIRLNEMPRSQPNTAYFKRSGRFGDQSVNEQLKAKGIQRQAPALSAKDQLFKEYLDTCELFVGPSLKGNIDYDEMAESIKTPRPYSEEALLELETKNIMNIFENALDELEDKYFDANGKFKMVPPDDVEIDEDIEDPQEQVYAAFVNELKDILETELNISRLTEHEAMVEKDYTRTAVSKEATQVAKVIFNLDNDVTDKLYEQVFANAFTPPS